MTKIAYLGPQGTFTEWAARTWLKDEERVPYKTIPACIDAVAYDEVDYAIVPLENAIEGSVNLTLDHLIHKHHFPIIGEMVVPIKQQLLVHPSRQNEWEETEEILSHPQAIAQCHEFLREDLPQANIQYTNSTSAAAKYVKEHPEHKIAAIANHLAAEQYGLSIVKQDIHDYENNHTRFVMLSKKEKEQPSLPQSLKTGEKTTLMVTLPSDYSGALHQVLSAFAWRNLNLTKIESRPMKTGLGHYFFVIDVNQQMDDVLIPGAIAELEALQCGVRVLGSYPCFTLSQVEANEKKPVPK